VSYQRRLNRAFLDSDVSHRSFFSGPAHTYVMVHDLGFSNSRPCLLDMDGCSVHAISGTVCTLGRVQDLGAGTAMLARPLGSAWWPFFGSEYKDLHRIAVTVLSLSPSSWVGDPSISQQKNIQSLLRNRLERSKVKNPMYLYWNLRLLDYLPLDVVDMFESVLEVDDVRVLTYTCNDTCIA
jgi:hypothetical protein